MEVDSGKEKIHMEIQDGGESEDVRKVCVKRTGEIVPFDQSKIESAVRKAILEVLRKGATSPLDAHGRGSKRFKMADVTDATVVAKDVMKRLEEDFWSEGQKAAVEDIQDRVEDSLMFLKFGSVAKCYILYRNEREKKRQANAALMGGKVDGLKMSENAIRLLEQRYLARDQTGKTVETPLKMFKRVARFIASAEKTPEEKKKYEKKFLEILSQREFLPASPVLMNSGSDRQLFPAFVFPLNDTIEEIYSTLLLAIHTQNLGGGTGFDFSSIRPQNDMIEGSLLPAHGPLAFMQVFAPALKTVAQSGRREGANMGILRVDHPDILNFIGLKARVRAVTNFNLSVGITDKFMEALANDAEYETINPRTGKTHALLSARIVFDAILTSSWQCGDPGLLFLDRINQDNPVPEVGKIEATSPCAEMPLLPFESCPEGALNLTSCLVDLPPPLPSFSWLDVPPSPTKLPFCLRQPTNSSLSSSSSSSTSPSLGSSASSSSVVMGPSSNTPTAPPSPPDMSPPFSASSSCPTLITPSSPLPSSPSSISQTPPRAGGKGKGKRKREDEEENEEEGGIVSCCKFDWEKLKRIVEVAVRFLDNCHEIQPTVDPKIDEMSRNGVRRIGLGLMGWADVLFALGIPYDSEQAIELARKISKSIQETAQRCSEKLAEERGEFGFWEKSKHAKEGKKKRRHGTLLCASPTGSISIIADASGGIEPNFALSYMRQVVGGGSYYVANTYFRKALDFNGVPKPIQEEIIRRGCLMPSDPVPSQLEKVFVTSQKIEPMWHVKMQAAWQENIDGAISKTVNLPNSATMKDVETVVVSAYKLGCKGITIYRDGSLQNQILNVGN